VSGQTNRGKRREEIKRGTESLKGERTKKRARYEVFTKKKNGDLLLGGNAASVHGGGLGTSGEKGKRGGG